MSTGQRADEGNWRNKRKCLSLTPVQADNLFFVNSGGKSKAAKEFCRGCPVISKCLTEALELGGPGFWAGTTERERRSMAEFLKLVPVQLEDFIPPVIRPKLRRVVPTSNVLGDPLYGVSGPSPDEELRMLEGLI